MLVWQRAAPAALSSVLLTKTSVDSLAHWSHSSLQTLVSPTIKSAQFFIFSFASSINISHSFGIGVNPYVVGLAV